MHLHRALGKVLLYGPRGRQFLMSQIPLYRSLAYARSRDSSLLICKTFGERHIACSKHCANGRTPPSSLPVHSSLFVSPSRSPLLHSLTEVPISASVSVGSALNLHLLSRALSHSLSFGTCYQRGTVGNTNTLSPYAEITRSSENAPPTRHTTGP